MAVSQTLTISVRMVSWTTGNNVIVVLILMRTLDDVIMTSVVMGPHVPSMKALDSHAGTCTVLSYTTCSYQSN